MREGMYEERRQELWEEGVLVVAHVGREGHDARYLAGLDERGATLVITPTGEARVYLVTRDPVRAHWEGALPPAEEVARRAGVAQTHDPGALVADVNRLARGAKRVWWSMREDATLDLALLDASRGRVVEDLRVRTAPMRAVKDAWELAQMREAARVTVEAHQAVRKAAVVGASGFELRAVFDGVLARHGYAEQAFDGIFAVGDEATCLHASPTSRRVADGELILVDAAARHPSGYASDMTRTWAVGAARDEVLAMRDVVARGHAAAVAACVPGATLSGVHDAELDAIASGLDALGFQGEPTAWFTHSIGHLIGLAVHDLRYGDVALEPGVALTIEPGLYVGAEDARAPAAYRGVGFRLEDVVVVTEDGAEVLTSGCPLV